MVKAIIIISVIALAVLSVQANDAKEKFIKARDACLTESGADGAEVQKAREGNFPDDDKIAAYMQCMFVKAGFMCADGTLHADVILKRTPASIEKATAEKIIEKCTTAKYDVDVSKLAYALYKCFRTNLGRTVIVA